MRSRVNRFGLKAPTFCSTVPHCWSPKALLGPFFTMRSRVYIVLIWAHPTIFGTIVGLGEHCWEPYLKGKILKITYCWSLNALLLTFLRVEFPKYPIVITRKHCWGKLLRCWILKTFLGLLLNTERIVETIVEVYIFENPHCLTFRA